MFRLLLLVATALSLLPGCAVEDDLDQDELDELEAGACPTQIWAPGVAFGWQPFWPDQDGVPGIDPIPVYDRFVMTLTDPGQREKWRTYLKQALREWHESGLRFRIIELDDPCSNYPGGYLAQAGAIQVCANTVDSQDKAGWWPAMQGSFLMIYRHAGFFQDHNAGATQGMIAHELGHTLGFGHSDSAGVMGGGWHVSDLEVRMARNYYFGGCM